MRKSFLVTASALCASAVSLTAFARDYDTSHLPYSDAPSDRSTAIAISVLTEAGVLQGDPGGTVRPFGELNRAEFLKIVMSLIPSGELASYDLSCFPDVRAGTWYAPYVCRAKTMGIVTGHARTDVPQSQWLFKPTSPVQYEEAVKVLAEIYALPLDTEGGEWYEPYLRAAQSEDLALDSLRPGDRIKRGEMARLVVAFLAFNEGEVEKLRDAEAGVSSASSVSTSSMSSSSVSSSQNSSSSAMSSSSSSSWQGGYDMHNDMTMMSQVAVLGSEGAIMGSVNLFSNNEPLHVTKIKIILVNSTSTLDSLSVYDEQRRFLGRAALDSTVSGAKTYVLRLSVGTLTLPRREDYSIYVRAHLKDHDQGGSSNQTIKIASFGIEGNGEWSNEEYSQTYTDTFPTVLTARAKIVSVENADPAVGNFTTGTKRLGAFRFKGEGDNQGLNNLRVTSLDFEISASSGVSVSDVYLKRQDGETQSPCTVSGNTISCPNIPVTAGSVKDESTIQIYGTIAVSNAVNPFFQVSINAAGTATTDGDITWTDGENTFTWVSVESPVASSTFFN